MERKGSYSNLLNFRLVWGLLSMSVKGYLIERGWVKSYISKNAVDINGKPIPWLTYSFLDFIEGRLDKNMSMFEYGSGNSTLFFSSVLGDIRSVEYDKIWYEKIKKAVSENVEMLFIDLEGDKYENTVLNQNNTFDLILIDGRRRVKCLKNSVEKLSERGVLILDDSEREEYRDGVKFMLEKGFKHLPFSGIAIGSIHGKCTSVFYRENNVLGI